jgi:predicted short-subunit dehydrogenase-like oxidoreductase (DUF2520 family)
MTLVVNIIGTGKLGKTIGRLLFKNKLAKIAGVYNRRLESSIAAIEFIGDGECFSEIRLLPFADLTFITTPDDRICETSIEICRSGNIRPGGIFIHCSGVLTSDVMSSVKIKEALIASIHPMKSFSNPALSVDNFDGTYCAMEGDIEALKIIEPIFNAIGSITYKIEKEKKSLYHAAGVFASNYLVTLSQQAINCLGEAGIEEEMAINIVISLMKGTLSNIEKSMSPREALTGPIKRADMSTIKTHLSSFSDCKQRFLYSTLGKATIPLTSHDLATRDQLEKDLSFISAVPL